MEMLSSLLALCEGNPPVTIVFTLTKRPLKLNAALALMFLCCRTEEAVEQTVKFPVIWDAAHVISLYLFWITTYTELLIHPKF